jgi:hypothetical protein
MINEKAFIVSFSILYVCFFFATILGMASNVIVLPMHPLVFTMWLSVAIGFPQIPLYGKEDFKGQKSFVGAVLLFSSVPIILYQILLFFSGYYG